MPIRALLFTDLVDSTDMVRTLGDEASAQVWIEHDRRARDLLAHHGGIEIDRTDGFFLLFETATSAARFAIGYHECIADLGLIARVGMHVGDILIRPNDKQDVARGAKAIEVEGMAKPVAARVMALARGAQTLLSPAARIALEGSALSRDVVMISHGHYRLKGLDDPLEISQLGSSADSFVPPADTDKVYRVVRTGSLWRPLRDVPHNLPAERDEFVGRTLELRALAQRLEAGARLITLLGPGGTGKTRLVRRYGLAWLGDWPGGVMFCDLSDARTIEGIYYAVASALGLALGKDATEQIGRAIAGRGRCLVILDNFEQVAQHAAATLGRWLDVAGNAAFVATSRESLHLPGEELQSIEPLPVDAEAIDLFVKRARAQSPTFALNDSNRASVAEVVRLVDGLPLAIELAASRVRAFSPSQLVLRMRDRFAILGGIRGAAARQATLKAAIDWSWGLLSPSEQAALAQCSVFEGGFTMQAAESVVDLSACESRDSVMNTIQALVDKSLVRSGVKDSGGRLDIDEPYFAMYLSIRDYASQKLDDSGDRDAAEWRHGSYFKAHGTDAALDALSRSGGVQRLHELAQELDNVVIACQRATKRGDAETAVLTCKAAWEVLELRGPFSVGGELARPLLALDLPGPLRAAVLMTHARSLRRAGRPEFAQEALEEAVELFRSAGARQSEASALGGIGLALHAKGDTARALEFYRASLEMHRSVNNRIGEGIVLGNLGNLHSDRCESSEALAHYEAAVELHREVGNRHAEGIVLGNLGALLNELTRFDEARDCLRQARDIHREVRNRAAEGNVTGNLGAIFYHQGSMGEALECFTTALAVHRSVGNRRFEAVVIANVGLILRAQGRIAESTSHVEQALAIHREVGDRRFEAYALGNLGTLLLEAGRLDEARRQLETGLDCARETSNRRLEGALLGRYAEALAKTGQRADATSALANAESILRGIDETLELATVLCIRGCLDVADGELERARKALAEAEGLASSTAAGPAAEVQLEIAKLRDMLTSVPLSVDQAPRIDLP